MEPASGALPPMPTSANGMHIGDASASIGALALTDLPFQAQGTNAMRSAFLESTEDMQWLQDVHEIAALEYRCALLYGNEDCPSKVELYARDHYKCKPTIYEADESGALRLIQTGQKPQTKFLADRPQTSDI